MRSIGRPRRRRDETDNGMVIRIFRLQSGVIALKQHFMSVGLRVKKMPLLRKVNIFSKLYVLETIEWE